MGERAVIAPVLTLSDSASRTPDQLERGFYLATSRAAPAASSCSRRVAIARPMLRSRLLARNFPPSGTDAGRHQRRFADLLSVADGIAEPGRFRSFAVERNTLLNESFSD